MLSNAYDMLALLRDNVGEVAAAQWTDANLLRRLNVAYYNVTRMVSKTAGQWLVKSASLTAVASVLTLPDDCSKLVYVEDSSGNPVNWLGSVAQRSVSRRAAAVQGFVSYNEVYPLKNTIEINSTSDTGTYNVWYQQRAIELHAGTASAGGVSLLTLQPDRNADVRNDYYNGATIDVVSGDNSGRYTITDYVGSTRVATLYPSSTPVQIEGLSKAAACVVTWVGHGLTAGSVIFAGITQAQWTALNGTRVITVLSADTFSVPINSSAFTLDYVPGTDVGTVAFATFAASDSYGIVPITPPECNDLIVISASLMALCKPSSTTDEKVLQLYVLLEQRTRAEVKEWLNTRVIENQGVTIIDSI